MSNIKNLRAKPLADRFRNSRTAAGFVSKPCETATANNAEMLPTKRIKSWMSFQNLWRTAMKRQTSKTSVQSVWPTASETAEEQQDSCRNHAKQRPRTMPKRCLRNRFRNSRTAAGFVSKPCETATTNNAEMLPTKRIRSWMSFQNLWRTAMKCQISKTSVPSLWRTASETAEQQQDSCPNHAKQRPRTMPKCCLRNALRGEWSASKTFGGRYETSNIKN